jgi:aspartate/methionine/tyrosine aminotransferase
VKLAWLAFAGPVARVDLMLNGLDVVADTYLSVSTPVQLAAATLLERGADIRHQIQQRTQDNLRALGEVAATVPEVSVLRVEGGWSAIIRVPNYRSEETLVLDLMTAEHVLVHPGYFFDFERETFIVVSLLVEPAVFAEAISRVLTFATTRPWS